MFGFLLGLFVIYSNMACVTSLALSLFYYIVLKTKEEKIRLSFFGEDWPTFIFKNSFMWPVYWYKFFKNISDEQDKRLAEADRKIKEFEKNGYHS